MKGNFAIPLRRVALALLMACGHAMAADPDPAGGKIDWPAFMGRHDMLFDKLPRGWTEAPHFGNAMVGSMLYQVDDTIRLQVFRADVHDHRDDTWGWTAYSRPRLQIGYFSLQPVGKLTGCRWRMDLWNAELTGTITTDRGEIRIRHYTHAVDMAIATELTPTAGERGCRWTGHPTEARTTRGGYPTKESQIAGFAKQYGSQYADTLKVYQPNPAGRLETGGGISVWIQDLLAGGQYATAWSEQLRGDTGTLFVSIANSYPESIAARTAVSDVKRFLALDRSGWVQLHRDWWHAYFPRSFVTIPDKGLESLYWQTIYRFGCTTRPGRCCVDTPGIESTLAAANIIQDMLIQSWSDPAKEEFGPIRIFPALPSAWKDVEFHELRAEGAFLVSAKRSAGRTQWVRIKSLAGEPCRVRPGMNGKIRIKGERQFHFRSVSPGIYEIELKKGEEVLLYAGSDPSGSGAADEFDRQSSTRPGRKPK